MSHINMARSLPSSTAAKPLNGAEEVAMQVAPLQPRIASITGACAYLGDIGPAKFYADILPQLEVVKLGRRTFVTIVSLDALIDKNKRAAGDRSSTPAATATGALAKAEVPKSKESIGTQAALGPDVGPGPRNLEAARRPSEAQVEERPR